VTFCLTTSLSITGTARIAGLGFKENT